MSADTITKAVQLRHSTRAFKSDVPVPFETLQECLNLAQQAPSNSNIQPWRLTVVEGAALTRLKKALHTAVESHAKPVTEPIPDEFRHYRSALGHELYGKQGYNVPREAKEQLERVRRRNYSFFDAPMAMILCMDNGLAPVDVLSCGLYLQTLCLLLQERGISNCIEVSAAGYPDVIRETLGIDSKMMVITTMAVGYEDENQQINKLRIARDEWKKSVTIVSD